MYNESDPLKSFIEWLISAFDNRFDSILYSHNGKQFHTHMTQIY